MDQLPAYSDPSYVSVHNPFDIPLHFLGLELVVYVCFFFTVRHAIGRHRAGDSYHLFQWIALFCYGVIIELVSFNFFQNYEHGTFSVQFYHGQLPLYVTCIYLVFHYTGIKMIERLNLPPIREALLCGLAIMLIDVPFDSLGVDAGWWIWIDNPGEAYHPRFIEAVKTRWFGVPVTSYYWYLMYGALLALLTRGVYAKIKQRSLALRLLIAPGISMSVMVLGALAFEIMFWLPRGIGISDHIIVATYLGFILAYAATTRAPNAQRAESWLLSNALLFHGYHLILMAGLWSQGRLTHGAGKLVLISCAIALSLTVVLALPLVGRAPKPAAHPEPSAP